MITVKVPATSANLGAAFDACGIALQKYNIVSMEQAKEISVYDKNGACVAADENHLIVKTVQYLYQKCDAAFEGLKLILEDDIPQARGLGSSSACIAASLPGGNELLGKPFSREQLMEFGVALEGHPDNIVPAFLGGFASAVLQGSKLYYTRQNITNEIYFAAFIPNFQLLTKKARAVLPEQVTHCQAAHNVSCAALLAAAFCQQNYGLLKAAMHDTLHQPYRLPLINGGKEVLDLAQAYGALGVFLSGAGPTLIAVVEAENTLFCEQMISDFKASTKMSRFAVEKLWADNEGAKVLLS